MERGNKSHQEFTEFVKWQIQHRIFDVNAKYVSYKNLIFYQNFWNSTQLNETALIWALNKGHIEVAKVLLEQEGIDFNTKDIFLILPNFDSIF